MINFIKYIQLRFQRGFSLAHLGPNESRVYYDFGVGFIMLLTSILINRIYTGSWADMKIFVLPLTFILVNVLIGIYAGLRTALPSKKTIFLSVSLLMTSIIGFFFLNKNISLLWFVLTIGPIILPRIILGIEQSRGQNIFIKTIRQRGPVLIVGGAGYIGTQAVELLLEAGDSVRVLDTLMYGSDPLSSFLSNDKFELIEGDATDIIKLTTSMKGCSAVVHLSGLVGDTACSLDPVFTRHANVIATRMVRDVAQSLGIYRFVFASSCSVYGENEKEVNENDELNPVSLYAQTKIDSEYELLHSPPDDFYLTILRFATVFGHSYRPRFDLATNLFTAQAMNDGIITVYGQDNWRPFVHVKDLARAVVMVLKAKPKTIQNQIFNVGDKSQNMTIMQVAEAVKEVVGQYREVDIQVLHDIADKRNYFASFEKINSILGFNTKTSIRSGIEEMAINIKNGLYKDYHDDLYSNVKVTEEAKDLFNDPMNTANLYSTMDEITKER